MTQLEAPPVAKPTHAEALYAFDVQGWAVLPNVVPRSVIDAALEVVERAARAGQDGAPPSVIVSGDPSRLVQINKVAHLDPALDFFIDVPEVLELVAATSAGSWRLNHTYALLHEPPNKPTHLHGGSSLSNVAAYAAQGGRVMSTLTKAVFPLVDCDVEDGCFAAIPGSHKGVFPRPPLEGETAHPLVRPIPAKAGDCIVFTEALCHGSVPATSNRPRRGLYYCYSAGSMRDWADMGFSQELLDRLPPGRREVIEMKGPGGG